jgi:Ca2+-binding EF-hand superfamily protein|tara:strand:+ start:394 stop:1677 length:1284 start_codon:yes stop_codon:yes gene_type:complete
MSTATSNTLLSSVEQFLSMTNPDTFTNEPPQEYVQQLDNATMDLHLNHISNLLTDTKQFSLQPTVPFTPSPPTQSPRKSGLKSPRSSSSSYKKSTLPMDSWNMNRSPKKHTHPYLRLYNLLNTKQERLKWQKQIYTIDEIIEAKCTGWTKYYKGKVTGINRDGSYVLEFEDGETKESVKTDQVRALSGRRRTSNRKTKHQIPKRQIVTLRLSSLEKKKRRNESILRKFVDVLKSSRSIYGQNPETLRDLFQTIDIDCNGTIDIAEFEKVIARVGFGLVSTEIIELANAIDDNDDGMIQYNELCTAISSMTRQGARRHVEHAKHHLSTASRHVHQGNHNNTTAIEDTVVSKFVEILLNASKSIVQSSEKLRRAFADADESKLGTITGNVFLNVVLGTGIATGRESDVAKIALGLQNQNTGEILYHDFL